MASVEGRTSISRPGASAPGHGRPEAGGADHEAVLLLAQSAARVGLWSWDIASNAVWHSEEQYRLHGVTPGALGATLEDYLVFIHPGDRTRITEGAWAATTGETVPMEYRFVHPEGGVRHLMVHSALVRDRSGSPQRLVGTVQDITEIERARHSVTYALSRVFAYFEALPTPAYLWRREGDELMLRRLNRAARERWGDRASEFLDVRASDFCADRPDIIADINRCLDEQVGITREMDYDYHGGGSSRLVVTYVPVAPDSVVAHADDISDLAAAHERERIATAHLAEYFQRVPTPAYLWREVDGEIVLEETNRAGIELTEGRVHDFIGVTAREMYVDRPDILEDFRRAVAGETFTREVSYELLTTGQTRDLVITYVHIPSGTVVAHTRDVTEQRRMERDLRDREAEMTSVMEGNPDGICLIVHGTIRRYNGSLATIMGCTTDELVGRALHDLMIPEDREKAQERGRAILAGGSSKPSEYTLIRCDGTLASVEIFGAGFEFRGDPALICTLRDVAGRKEAEHELAASRDALRALTQHLELVREEERLQVARDLHDELGSVLTALKIDCGEILASEPVEASPEVLAGMSDLLDQAIEVGRRVTARLRPGILDDLGLAAAAEWLGADLEKRTGIRCTVTLPSPEPTLPEPIATAMFRILQEALTNVMRHAEADDLTITLQAEDGWVSLVVADDGIGFDVHAPVGSGFGLLGMRERVRAFDGTMDITSSPGTGTEVAVRLPLPG